MTAVLLQMRLDSTRLPGKALLPLMGIPVAAHVMRALKGVNADIYALLCPEDSFDELAALADSEGFLIMAGPKEDVLARYTQAIKKWNIETVIRATGDNPLVSAALANSLLIGHKKMAADYSGYRNIPVGSGVEIVRAESLILADQEAASSYEREHVSPFLYNNPDRFVINRPLPADPVYHSSIRVTLDTDEDYDNLKRIFKDLWRGGPIPLEAVIGRNPK